MGKNTYGPHSPYNNPRLSLILTSMESPAPNNEPLTPQRESLFRPNIYIYTHMKRYYVGRGCWGERVRDTLNPKPETCSLRRPLGHKAEGSGTYTDKRILAVYLAGFPTLIPKPQTLSPKPFPLFGYWA